MAAHRYDVRTPRGDSFVSKTFAIVIDGLGVDLGDWNIVAQVRRQGVVVHEFDGDEIITGSGLVDYKDDQINTGWLRVEAPDAVTALWPIGVGEWDWEISKDDQRYTIVDGSFRVSRDVTR